jgi:histidyl-tRNA synthetase
MEKVEHQLDAYLIMVGDNIERSGIKIAEQIRDQLPEFRLLVNHGGGSFKSQMKRADKSGARYAFILGEDEVLNGMIAVKDLQTSDQQHIEQTELVSYITSLQSAV